MTKAARANQYLPMPIAEMGPWFFWAMPAAIGLPPADAAAITDGTANEEQKLLASQLAQAAMHTLLRASANQAYMGKPS